MKNFASIFGWILLLAVLAVPSFLFYNWWSANKAKEAQLAASQQGVPRDFFPGDEKLDGEADASPAAPSADSQPLVTPDQPGADQPEAAPAGGETEEGKQPEPPLRPAEAEPPGEEPQGGQPAPETAGADPSAGETPAEGAAEAEEDSPEAASYFEPKTERNPFLTPDDYARIRADEYRRRQEARQRSQANQKPREVRVESRITIQGIVGTNVIINGEMYSRGDTVLGAKIIRIGPNYIIGEHKGRRFRKYMQ
ncbi:MAG: hypothetical protein RQ748_06930 [Elusimicrobiales bacterium]|nr:hypothetical protein [Elusimicrobiales bacterium]